MTSLTPPYLFVWDFFRFPHDSEKFSNDEELAQKYEIFENAKMLKSSKNLFYLTSFAIKQFFLNQVIIIPKGFSNSSIWLYSLSRLCTANSGTSSKEDLLAQVILYSVLLFAVINVASLTEVSQVTLDT